MIVDVSGLLGSGKTTFLVLLCLKAQKNNIPIYSNFKLKIPYTYLDLNVIYDLVDNKKQIDQCLFAIDELYLWCDSRLSGQDEINRVVSYFVMQSRKRKVTLAFSSQLLGTVDLRIRYLTDYIVLANKLDAGGHKYIITRPDGTFSYRILPPDRAKEIYDLFDTFEIIDIRSKEKFAIEKKGANLKDAYAFFSGKKHADNIKRLSQNDGVRYMKVKKPYLNSDDCRLIYKMVNDHKLANGVLGEL